MLCSFILKSEKKKGYIAGIHIQILKRSFWSRGSTSGQSFWKKERIRYAEEKSADINQDFPLHSARTHTLILFFGL